MEGLQASCPRALCTTCSQWGNIKDKADKTVLGIENEITDFVCVLALQPFSQMDAIIVSNQIPTCVSYRKRSKANWLAGYVCIYTYACIYTYIYIFNVYLKGDHILKL